ncbi:MAG TPA: DUF4114 domain-containing protein [Steroidobacteraceae bacterium]
MRVAVLQAAGIAGLALCGGQVYAACTFGGSGEPSLQGALDGLVGPGVVNVQTGCVSDGNDAAWSTLGSVGEVDIAIQLSDNASSDSFGIYDLNDPSRRLTVFGAGDGVNSVATVKLSAAVGGGWNVRVRGDSSPAWSAPMTVATSAFGFYLSTASNGTFFSNTGLNADGVDHMYAYQGTGTGDLNGDVFDTNAFILAWEDLAGGGDRDYQDFVAVVQDMKPSPVPLPTAIWLLASGLISLTGVARRRA